MDSGAQHRMDQHMEGLLHRARRLVLDVFGPEPAMHHPAMTVQIATALATLEAAETISHALKPGKDS